jgi:putative nucleotidyltransferase with HDIG domain
LSSVPRVLAGWILVIATCGLAATVWALPRVHMGVGLIAVLAVLLVEWFPSKIRKDVEASLTNVVVLIAVIYGGAPLAIVAAWGTLLPFSWRAAPPRVLRVAFNVGQFAVSGALAGWVYEGLLALFDVAFPHGWSLLAIAVAAIAFTLSNRVMVGGAVALSTREPLHSAFRSLGPATLLEIPYVGIAVLGAVVLMFASPWALLLMALPALVARHALLSFQRLDEAYDRLVRSFVKAIEVKDLYTRGHSERVSQLSVEVAEELGVAYEERRLTRYAALLHDVGKIGVPLCVINKPGPLDDAEFEQIKQHPTIGAEILGDIDFLAPAIDIVRLHHERLDGCGYPHGIGGDDLSLIVRIVTAVDAFDAMTSTRSYRRAFSVREAVEELRRCAGRQFDPTVVEALDRTVQRIGWTPTIDFASESELQGREIPTGTLAEREQPEVGRWHG